MDRVGEERSATPFRVDIVTLFPEMFAGPFDLSMVARARAAGIVELGIHDLRRWTTDRHRTTDDYAFGGGGGMVLKPEPLFLAVEELLRLGPITAAAAAPFVPPVPIVLLTPQGRRLDHGLAAELAAGSGLVLLCGHYEGFDERVREQLATHEVSIGDYVLTGGELPAMVLTDAVVRLRPGVLGLEGGAHSDSFATGLLEHPHFTRPADFRGWRVPEVLLGGDHGAVERWRRREALARTARRRPELLSTADLTAEERRWLSEAFPELAQRGIF
jgi:tRNA (guanine37-N1)-methyltransferase